MSIGGALVGAAADGEIAAAAPGDGAVAAGGAAGTADATTAAGRVLAISLAGGDA